MTDIKDSLEAVAAEMLGKSEAPEASEEQLDEISWDQPKKGAAPAEKMQSVPVTRQDMGPAVVSPDATSDPGDAATKKAKKATPPGSAGGKGLPSGAKGTAQGNGSGPMAVGAREEHEAEGADVITEEEVEEETIEERISSMDFSDDAQALSEGEDDLSDEFKKKAATILEAAIKSKLREEMERLEEKYQELYAKELDEAQNEMAEQVDGYLNYVVQEWMKKNEMAVEHKMKTEIADSFIAGLRGLFEEHNIAMPDEQYDMLDAAAEKVDELEGKLNESIEMNVELTKENGEFQRNEILLDVASDLADTEVEKFAELTESIEFEGADEYRTKVNTIKESYFPKASVKSDDNTTPVTDTEDTEMDVSDNMAAYLTAITRGQKHGVGAGRERTT